MCGRFFLLADLSKILTDFDIQDVMCDYKPSPNILPGQPIMAVIQEGGINRLTEFQWGLIPAWAKDPVIDRKMINARSETIAEKPSFKAAFQKRRCLIVADGFYEWRKTGNRKMPVQLFLKSERPFGFAGLYESWHPPAGPPINTCTIITTQANALIAPIHDRMPVIVPKGREKEWLDPKTIDARKLLPLLKPFPADEMAIQE